MLRIHFETPLHRWMLVRFEADEQTFTLGTSAIVYNSLLAFVEIPLGFIHLGEGRGRVDDLPLTYEIVLRRKAERAILEVFELPDFGSFSDAGVLVFTGEDTLQALLLMWWRALRNLESRFDKAHWRYEFPTEAVERLGKIVKDGT